MRSILVVISLFAASVGRADEPATPAGDDPTRIVQKNVEDVLAVLRDPALKGRREERMRRIRDIADRVFDWRAMAQRSLGVHWRGASEAERARFVAVFVDLLADKYRSDMDRFFGDEKVEVLGSESIDPDRRVVHTILLTHARERVPIDYHMARENGAWRAFDVSIEGVSLVNHYRGTFSRYLANRSFPSLLEQLERKQAGKG